MEQKTMALDLETVREAARHVPLFAMVAGGVKMNIPRMIEALIIAAITAGATAAIGMYVAIPVIKAEIGMVQVEVKRVEQRIEELNRENKNDRAHDAEEQAKVRERLSRIEALTGKR